MTALAAAFESAGMSIGGKSACPQLSIGVTTEPAGFTPTHNPWDQSRSAGRRPICYDVRVLPSLRWRCEVVFVKLANVAGRASILVDAGAIDVEDASSGEFSADVQLLYDRWDEFRSAAATFDDPARPFRVEHLGAPAPRPRQVFGIGLNYARHAAEAGVDRPGEPPVFTKFPTCITGPSAVVALPTSNVDWEVELVVVIGRGGRAIPATMAWDHVAGLTIGQDLSERVVQMRPPVPQFSMGKSFPGFGPTGPHLVTADELDDPDNLDIGCTLNGETVQFSNTGDMIFPVGELVARLSAIVPLLPGDLIFSGTPAGVGAMRTPPRFLQAGDELVSTIAGVGTMTTRLAGSG